MGAKLGLDLDRITSCSNKLYSVSNNFLMTFSRYQKMYIQTFALILFNCLGKRDRLENEHSKYFFNLLTARKIKLFSNSAYSFELLMYIRKNCLVTNIYNV